MHSSGRLFVLDKYSLWTSIRSESSKWTSKSIVNFNSGTSKAIFKQKKKKWQVIATKKIPLSKKKSKYDELEQWHSFGAAANARNSHIMFYE